MAAKRTSKKRAPRKRKVTRTNTARAERRETKAPKKKTAKRKRPVARKRRKNPAEAAAKGYKDFHGRASERVVTVSRKVHFHEHLAAAGALIQLEVAGVDGQVHIVEKFDGAILAFNEKKNQLFIEGGNQKINLREYGLTTAHERYTLGKVNVVEYFTRKDHLVEGGRAIYRHRFSSPRPDLIYSAVDEQLEFSGGAYTIKDEGIDL